MGSAAAGMRGEPATEEAMGEGTEEAMGEGTEEAMGGGQRRRWGRPLYPSLSVALCEMSFLQEERLVEWSAQRLPPERHASTIPDALIARVVKHCLLAAAFHTNVLYVGTVELTFLQILEGRAAVVSVYARVWRRRSRRRQDGRQEDNEAKHAVLRYVRRQPPAEA